MDDLDRRTTPPTEPPPPLTPRGEPPVERAPGDRRRLAWREFRRAYPGLLATMGLALAVLLAMNGWLWYKRQRYAAEIQRLRSGMTDVERRRADMELRAGANALKVQWELLRRQARIDEDLHLSISVDSATMYLEQGGAQLRVMPIEIGPDRTIGTPPDTVRLVAPRGKRTIERVVGAKEAYTLPAWVWHARGQAPPADRSSAGALGPVAIVLNGGTIVYSLPSSGPLADTAFVMPGAVRARASDLRAIAPNLKSGQTVYFY